MLPSANRVVAAVAASVLIAIPLVSTTLAQSAPEFRLGFKTLADLLGPGVPGQPLENEHFNPANGDSLQQTTTGLMVWRKADNWTAFTNGYMTWINGPYGVQGRLNTERFPWESVVQPPTSTPTGTSAPAQPPTVSPAFAPTPTPPPPLAAPVLISPANGARIDGSRGVTFSWEAVPGATSYYLSYGWGPSNNWNIGWISGTSFAYPGELDPAPVPYHWSVQARNCDGVGPKTAAWSFTIPGTPRIASPATIARPNPPELVGPANGTSFSLDQNGVVAVGFSWNPVPGASGYRLRYSGPAPDGQGTVTDFPIQDCYKNSAVFFFGYPGTYTWRVKSVGCPDDGPFGQSWSFTIR